MMNVGKQEKESWYVAY